MKYYIECAFYSMCYYVLYVLVRTFQSPNPSVNSFFWEVAENLLDVKKGAWQNRGVSSVSQHKPVRNIDESKRVYVCALEVVV